MYKEERDGLEEEMREIDECDMDEFGTLYRSEKAIAILGVRWWPQAAKQRGDKISRKERRSVSKGMSGRWSNDLGKQQKSTPPPPPLFSIGWVGVGRQRHCETCRSLRELLDNLGTVFFFSFFFLAVTHSWLSS